MGRIKTQLVKRKTFELMERYGEKFSSDFEENKKHVEDHTKMYSRKLRNLIAGYITRLKKAQ